MPWDGGSTLLFITFRQARQLKLIGEKVHIEIVKVGGMVEELDSFCYNVTLVDKAGLPTDITDIKAMDIDGVRKLFKSQKAQDVDRPKEGEIDCLPGYEYAAFHPVRIQAIVHLLLLHNRFKMVIRGKHPKLIGNMKRIVQHVMIYHANVNIQMEDFYSIERLGVRHDSQGGYNLVEEKLVYKPD